MQSSRGVRSEGPISHQRGALNGDDLRAAFLTAAQCLDTYRDAVNALNVFPVPDGDTGTNMLLTMRAVNQAAEGRAGDSAGDVAAAMAQGALMNSRGNSGVILSQFFHGLSLGLRSKDTFGSQDISQAFHSASQAANRAVSKPVQGTMLTVISEAAAAVSRCVEDIDSSQDVLAAWQAALGAAKDALCKTPLQLAVLREAGVVDAGGQGFVILLEGACRHLCNEPIDYSESWLSMPVLEGDGQAFQDVSGPGFDPSVPSVSQEYLQATQDELYGYCTQFLLSGEEIDVEQLRTKLAAMADSTVVVGHESLAKVHLHTHDPGPIISFAVTLGTISQISMENIDQQHHEFVALHSEVSAGKGEETPTPTSSALAVVAVASGEGFASLFLELGCAGVVPGGQTMNPSTGDLLESARSTGAGHVVILPNNSNIVPAARQAADLAGGAPVITVLPSRTLPQGVAALLSFNPEGETDANLEGMERALGEVQTLEITQAVRDAAVGGTTIERGQYMALHDGKVAATGESASETLVRALSVIMEEDASASLELVTLYWGEDVGEGEASEAAEMVRQQQPALQVQSVHGGQPHYHYIVSLE